MKTINMRNDLVGVPSKRWLAYVAASASFASVMESSADAALVHVVPNAHVSAFGGGSGAYDGAVETPGVLQFRHFDFGGGDGEATFSLADATTASVAGFLNSGRLYVQNLADGVILSELTSFVGFTGVAGDLAYGNIGGQFQAAGEGLIGFRFDVGMGTQYGWARVDMDGAPGNSYTVLEYAYNGAGESGLGAGDLSAVPEPASLGLLALGAAGVAVTRRRKAAKA